LISDVKPEIDCSDIELIEGIRNGNKELLNVLYERYSSKVYRKCIGMTGDINLAKDLTHDIFIKIITKLHTFKGTSKFSLWVHSITHNHCINFLVKEKRVQFEELDSFTEENLSLVDIESQHVELLQIRVAELMRLMQLLDPREKEILLLRYQDELSLKEIAEALDIGASAAKMRLKRSRDKLANLLKHKEGTE